MEITFKYNRSSGYLHRNMEIELEGEGTLNIDIPFLYKLGSWNNMTVDEVEDALYSYVEYFNEDYERFIIEEDDLIDILEAIEKYESENN